MLHVHLIPRAGALAFAGLTAALTASPAPERAELPPGPPPARVARLVALSGVERQRRPTIAVARLPAGRSRLAPADVPAPIERVATGLIRRERERGRPRFPVAGPFNWGQGGARFGAGRGGHSHQGQDVFGRAGTPLVAVTDGVVTETGQDGGRGNYLGLYDPRSERTYVYLHLLSPLRLRAGQGVRGGQRVGRMGCTGSCFGDHLHFEIRRGRGLAGTPTDPLPRLRAWARASGARATLPPGAH